tara:strand:+ start:4919 stop:5149 length:231 start_codon:yes stop_codon:yes gene_type:complete
MTEQDILIQEGMNLLYSGMTVVFTFLVLLIISVNVLRIFFSLTKERALDSNDLSPATGKNEIHHKIIKEVLGGIRS